MGDRIIQSEKCDNNIGYLLSDKQITPDEMKEIYDYVKTVLVHIVQNS